jgi:transcriptional regulator with AAA-type ATPase domain
LSQEVTFEIARSLQPLKVEPNAEIYRQGLKPVGLYLLKWGSVEIYRLSLLGKTHITYRNAGEVFGYVPLVENREITTYRASAAALTKCEIWFLPEDDFNALKRTYPEIHSVINHLLAQDLADFSQRIAKEQARIQGLQQYIRPVPMGESVIGKSKASKSLAQQIDKAADDIKPVIFQAPPGSGKTFLAGLIHGRSGLKNRPFAEIDCAELPRDEAGVVDTDSLFGKEGEQLGVIELLERGTLLIDNIQLLSHSDRDRLSNYLKTGSLTPNSRSGKQMKEKEFSPSQSLWVRLILASPNKISLPNIEAHQIKLFSLPQRKQDIPDLAQYFLA